MAKAKITYKKGASYAFKGHTFKKNKAVQVEDEEVIRRCMNTNGFLVANVEGLGLEREEEVDDTDLMEAAGLDVEPVDAPKTTTRKPNPSSKKK